MTTPPKQAPRLLWPWLQLLRMGRWIAEPEKIPRVERETPKRRANLTVIQLLVSADTLPRHATHPRHHSHLLAWLAASEQLPAVPETPPRRHTLGLWWTSREPLPAISADSAPASTSFPRWLLMTAPHERLENHPLNREVPFDES